MLTRSKLSGILTDMKENAVTTRVNQFIRDYRRFKEFAANGGRVKITDRQGQQFVFMPEPSHSKTVKTPRNQGLSHLLDSVGWSVPSKTGSQVRNINEIKDSAHVSCGMALFSCVGRRNNIRPSGGTGPRSQTVCRH